MRKGRGGEGETKWGIKLRKICIVAEMIKPRKFRETFRHASNNKRYDYDYGYGYGYGYGYD